VFCRLSLSCPPLLVDERETEKHREKELEKQAALQRPLRPPAPIALALPPKRSTSASPPSSEDDEDDIKDKQEEARKRQEAARDPWRHPSVLITRASEARPGRPDELALLKVRTAVVTRGGSHSKLVFGTKRVQMHAHSPAGAPTASRAGRVFVDCCFVSLGMRAGKPSWPSTRAAPTTPSCTRKAALSCYARRASPSAPARQRRSSTIAR